jgi:hypothetical protein
VNSIVTSGSSFIFLVGSCEAMLAMQCSEVGFFPVVVLAPSAWFGVALKESEAIGNGWLLRAPEAFQVTDLARSPW